MSDNRLPDTALSTAKGFLCGDSSSDRHSSGRLLLAECPEFRLFEMDRPGGELFVENSAKVERAYWKATFRIQMGDSVQAEDQQIAWGLAFMKLRDFTASNAHHLPPANSSEEPFSDSDLANISGSVQVAVRLATTIGWALQRLIEEPESERAVDALVKNLRNAVGNYTAGTWIRGDGRSGMRTAVEAALIDHARITFMHERRRPHKTELRESVESIGYKKFGKNAKANWVDAFNRAGLADLPD